MRQILHTSTMEHYCSQIKQNLFWSSASVTLSSMWEKLKDLPITYSDIYGKVLTKLANPYATYIRSSFADGLISKTALKEIDCPQLTSIGNFAFSGCTQLSTIHNMSNITSIGQHAFRACDFRTVDLPLVTGLTTGAFYGNYNLTTVNAPSATGIGPGAFYSCKNLSEITVSPDLTTVWEEAFYACSKLTSISLPNCTTLSRGAFWKAGITSIDLPKIDELWGYSGGLIVGQFRECKSLISVNIPSCSYIFGAFYECTSLTDISCPKLETIQSGAFAYCSALPTISLPACTFMRSNAFNYCTNLSTVYLLGSSVATTEEGKNPFQGCTNLQHIYVPHSLYDIYMSTTCWASVYSYITDIENV